MVTSAMILVFGAFGIIIAIEMLTHIDSQPPKVPPGYPAPNAAAFSPPPPIMQVPVPDVKPEGLQELLPAAP
jgi:hypothetical protein